LRRLAQRRAELPARRVVAFNRLGFAYSRAQARHPAPSAFLEYNRRLAERIIAHSRFTCADAVYGFCGASVQLFRAAKAQGKRCFLEQMIAPVAEMVAQVRAQEQRWPGWAASAADQWDERAWTALEQEEWALADRVLAPSPYVRDCLVRAGVAEAKIILVPYGVKLPPAGRLKLPPVGRPLRVLYAGAIDLRKGAPNLIEAVSQFASDEVELRMAGRLGLRPEKLTALPANIRLLGQVSRAEMGELYEWTDVFALPSVCEGSATVTYEALVRGVPVVVSHNTGAPIEDGRSGTLLPDVSPGSIASALHGLIGAPERIAMMSAEALRQREDLSWDAYGLRILGACT
jgi:glycosyltransferase involved in cell wall biosynthesis